jgi:glutathione S-transferase
MKLYTSVGPNPGVVRMFMAERGIELPLVTVDIRGGENRRAPYLAINPSGQTPALELDNGTVIAEITAICEYLDEKFPGPSLIGKTAEERAETRMWMRRIDLAILEPMANGFRYSDALKMFENRIRCIPEAAPGLKALAREKLAWLDRLMRGKTYICGERFTLADILLFRFVEFFADVGQPLDPACEALTAWRARIKARPSAAA